MKKRKKINYTDEAIKAEIITDFLPSPDELVLKEDTVKITLALTKSSLEFFKEQAEEAHVPYQKMIRTLLDSYASHYSD